MEKTGIIHYNVSDFSIEELLAWCRDNGVGYVELMASTQDEGNIGLKWQTIPQGETRKPEEVSGLLHKYGIKVSQLTACNDFIKPTREEVDKEVARVEIACRIIKDMGFNQLRIDGGWPKEDVDEKDYSRLVKEGVSRAAEIAEKEGVYMALDNHGKVTNNHLLMLDILQSVDSKYLGTNLDTMNYRWYGYPVEKLAEIYRAVAPRVLHTHLKDGVMQDGAYKGRVLGEGEIPMLEAINILKDAGYNGVWCIEYEGADGIEGYKKCVEWLRNR